MSKRILSLGFLLGLFWSTVAVVAQEQASKPTFKEGDTWQFNITRKAGSSYVSSTDFNEGMYELMISYGNVKLYTLEGGKKEELVINQEGPTQALLTLIGKSDQRPNLKFPLSVGQKWAYSFRQKPAGARRDIEYSVEVKVAGIEQVTTPAGTFNAYRLVADTTWGRQGHSTSTYFYSPETRSMVKRSGRNENTGGTVETELVKFTPGS